jgi:hypothetical protein
MMENIRFTNGKATGLPISPFERARKKFRFCAEARNGLKSQAGKGVMSRDISRPHPRKILAE